MEKKVGYTFSLFINSKYLYHFWLKLDWAGRKESGCVLFDENASENTYIFILYWLQDNDKAAG